MIKKLFTYPMTYTIALLIVYSVYDYFEHIGRSGSTFEEHPMYWLLFSSAAVLSFILVVMLVKKVIEEMTNQKTLAIEVLSIGIWLALYIAFIGPLIDKFFWPYDDLYFSFSFGLFFIILTAYFIIRMIINLITGKKVLYSK
ncbi:MAG TPA: hypothetical protein VIS27_08155 [Yeosuana sp.]